MRLLPGLLLLLVFSSACNDGLPKGILPPEKMQAVFSDYLKYDVYTNEIMHRDSSINPVEENLRLQNQLFAKHRISREQFYESYEYYVAHTELMNQLLDTVTNRMRRQETMYVAKSGSPADSIKKIAADTVPTITGVIPLLGRSEVLGDSAGKKKRRSIRKDSIRIFNAQ